VLELGGDLDPDEYIQQRGVDAYRKKLASAPGYFTWLADQAKRKFDLHTAEGRMQGFQFLLPSIKKIHSALERAAVANEVANYLGVEAGMVLEQFKRAAEGRKSVAQSPASLVPAVERLLLNTVLLNQEAREAALPQLNGLAALDGLATRRILETMLALYRQDPAFRFDDLDGRLADSDRDLLAKLIFADEVREEAFTVEQALACVDRLKQGERSSQRAALRARIRDSERAGQVDEALRLMKELDEWERGSASR
jgi:DNA primase